MLTMQHPNITFNVTWVYCQSDDNCLDVVDGIELHARYSIEGVSDPVHIVVQIQAEMNTRIWYYTSKDKYDISDVVFEFDKEIKEKANDLFKHILCNADTYNEHVNIIQNSVYKYIKDYIETIFKWIENCFKWETNFPFYARYLITKRAQ